MRRLHPRGIYVDESFASRSPHLLRAIRGQDHMRRLYPGCIDREVDVMYTRMRPFCPRDVHADASFVSTRYTRGFVFCVSCDGHKTVAPYIGIGFAG